MTHDTTATTAAAACVLSRRPALYRGADSRRLPPSTRSVEPSTRSPSSLLPPPLSLVPPPSSLVFPLSPSALTTWLLSLLRFHLRPRCLLPRTQEDIWSRSRSLGPSVNFSSPRRSLSKGARLPGITAQRGGDSTPLVTESRNHAHTPPPPSDSYSRYLLLSFPLVPPPVPHPCGPALFCVFPLADHVNHRTTGQIPR